MPIETPGRDSYLSFVREEQAQLRLGDRPPRTNEDWITRRRAIQEAMFAALGPEPEINDPRPRVVGEIDRPNYRIEKLVFQTYPDAWMTATAYVPKRAGKLPAVLCVHGHWPWARRDPVVQARCAGLANLGFFVLAVDAFGAGERAIKPAKGTYHGALTGASLWPIGRPLSGIQLHENRRAVDYLMTRPEVDGSRLGVTGASGGGNQTMYAGAFDERLKAVVPVCSVGTYRVYLGTACCVCEVVPGGQRITEEGELLGMVAPRSLLVITASKDAIQFSPGEARKSIDAARPIFTLLGAPDRLRHHVFESGHDYSQPMRELMYGWMTGSLKGGSFEPIPEPASVIETVEDLACYPPGTRPASFHTIPSFVAERAATLKKKRVAPDHLSPWQAEAMKRVARLKDALGPGPTSPPASAQRIGEPTKVASGSIERWLVPVEKGIALPVEIHGESKASGKDRLIVDLAGSKAVLDSPLVKRWLESGDRVTVAELRATGSLAPQFNAIADAPDHNAAEWGVWIGRPLLGQWVEDTRTLVNFARQRSTDVKGPRVTFRGPACVVGLALALSQPEWFSVELIDLVTELAPGSPSRDLPMGLFAPGLLAAGDIEDLLALAAPRAIRIEGVKDPAGNRLDADQLKDAFPFARAIFRLHGKPDNLVVAAFSQGN